MPEGDRTACYSPDTHLGRDGCESTVLANSTAYGLAVHGKGPGMLPLSSWKAVAAPAHPPVGDAGVACRPADELSDSSLAKPQRLSPDAEGMQQHTHLARFVRFAAIPLTLFA